MEAGRSQWRDKDRQTIPGEVASYLFWFYTLSWYMSWWNRENVWSSGYAGWVDILDE
jgi:hypothetical protein